NRSLADPWRRHFLDSAQLFPLLPKDTRSLVDLGSGAGFPGLVLGVLGVPEVHLVESDGRKCAFLREVARETGVSATIHIGRIEDLSPWPADVVTARALAPLDSLLSLALPFLDLGAAGLFLKGKSVFEELTEAKKSWKMAIKQFPSQSDPDGVILRLGNVQRVN
ncbi:MAG: 16S rRNA (guanine(527)-N(7))-methyltransferase RsmG, partial [Alphaproteobacteria bacterium]